MKKSTYNYMINKYGKRNVELQLVNDEVTAFIYGIMVDFKDESFYAIEDEYKKRKKAKEMAHCTSFSDTNNKQ